LSAAAPIPVTLLTGFLGSGKTTLLRELLREPEFGDTLVLMNEIGEIGLDQQLVRGGGGATVLLDGGCICCSAGDDLGAALEELWWQRLQRRVPAFGRVVIESTGLADPLPVIQRLAEPGLVGERFALERVVCTVDAPAGMPALARHPECRLQVALADLLVLTKTDLQPDTAPLEAKLRRLNDAAVIVRPEPGASRAGLIAQVRAAPGAPAIRRERAAAALAITPAADDARRSAAESILPGQLASGRIGPLHHGRVRTFTVRVQGIPREAELSARLDGLIERFGGRLLRIKGRVRTESGWRVVQASAGGRASIDHSDPDDRPDGEAPDPSFLVLIAEEPAGDDFRTQVSTVLHFDAPAQTPSAGA